MRSLIRVSVTVLLAAAVYVPSIGRATADPATAPRAAYVPLAPESAEVFARLGSVALDNPASGRVPNYLRALAASHPSAVQAFAHLFRTVLYGGTIASETKAAMGFCIARENGSDYLSAHLTRILKSTEKGQRLLGEAEKGTGGEEAERLATRYAVQLTRAIHGVSDADFAQTRRVYNDAQLVELTAVTCFFNYFARFCQGAGLPLEAWVQETPNALPSLPPAENDLARVSLASDAELQMAAKLAAPNPELKKGLGIGVANSQRAMLRVPDIGSAWWDYWGAIRKETKLGRETQLHISFAVSMLNGCRYCVLHQVSGLRRLGIEPAKLLAMKKDDSALSPKELAAVTFARKLTGTPGAMRDADFAALRTGLGEEQEAMDTLLQTCAFSFMNCFTDGLRLPSEDEAVHVYQEVYGEGAYRAFPRGKAASNSGARF